MIRSNEEHIKYTNAELFGKGNLDIIGEIFTADYLVHAGGKDYGGHEIIRKFIGQVRSAIPDLQIVKITILNQTNDTITWQRTFSGMHEADMMGIPPTRKKVEWRDMLVTRFDGEKIAEEWTVSELAGELLLKIPGG